MSDKYNVNGLMDVCRCFLIKKMTVDNVYRAAILGHLHSDDVLKDAALQKLVKSGKSFKEIPNWKDLSNYQDLTFEIIDFYSKSVGPDTCKPPPPKRSKLSLHLGTDSSDSGDTDNEENDDIEGLDLV